VARIKSVGFLLEGEHSRSDPFFMHFTLPLAPHFLGDKGGILYADNGVREEFNIG
jgi:hypothetical protein